MGMVGVFPYSVITPWIIQGFFFVAVVWIMIVIGKDIWNKKFGLILGLFTAISTAQINQSVNLTSPSMVGIFSFFSLYFFIRYIKTGFQKNAFWVSFMVATSINIHFQSIGLFILIPLAFILGPGKNFRKIIYFILGWLIPFIPLIFFDLTNNFFESRNWIEYLRHGQYAIYVPNRWLTYVGVYWPNSWAKIIGGVDLIGYLVLMLLPFLVLYSLVKIRLSKVMFAIIISFLLIFFMLRYYRGERIDSYLTFLHPFIITLTAWVVMRLWRVNRFLGIALFLIISIFTLNSSVSHVKGGENFTAIQAREWSEELIKSFPNKKFSIYDYQYKHVNKSLPLVLFLESKEKIDDNGLKVGLYIATTETNFTYPDIIGSEGGYQILNLDATSSAYLSQEEWAHVNTGQIYKSTVEWYKKDKK